jgi:dipeptidase E
VGETLFLLVKAFRQSGFGKILSELVKKDELVYAGYSAAFCAVSPTLHGVELVDDKNAKAKRYEQGEVWEGFGLIDFCPIVHFRSNHHESDRVEKWYDYVKSNNIPFKTFKDGDVYIVDGDNQLVLN